MERDGALLLVRHEKPGREPYWVLPGGRLEPGETIPECASREASEETGLTARFERVLYVNEFMREDRHTVDVTALVTAEGEATLGSDPEVEQGAEPTLQEVRWIRFGELGDINLLPERVRERLARDAGEGWPEGEVYLGGDRD